MTVTLSGISHTFPGDIDVLLVAPGEQSVVLMSDAGGSFDLSGTTLTFDDDAGASLPANGQIAAGTYRPTNLGAGDILPRRCSRGPPRRRPWPTSWAPIPTARGSST